MGINDLHRLKTAEATRRQYEGMGIPSLSQLRLDCWARRARELGWPDDLGPRHLQILHHLYHTGPMTRREIAAAIGTPWKGSRKSLVSNDPEGLYLAHLMNRGLVVSLGRLRKFPGKGKGSSLQVYSIPLHVHP